MKRLLLLDAYAIIYRAYYAFIKFPRINSKGLNTSAIYGFVNTLEDVLKRENPTHVAVAFDPPGKTFRHEAYEHYKAQREMTPEDIRTAVPIIKEIIRAYNIPVLEVAGFEADDVIGTIAKKAEKESFEVLMVTPDKDYGQLVSEHIFIYRPKHSGGYEVMGPEAVKKKFEIESQEQVIDLLGLMGDASDNIPGCPGVGEKTAVKLLKQFGSIDELLKRTDELSGAIKTKIEDNKELIEFSRFLATIKTDVPIEFDEEVLKMEPINEAKLREIFEELEFYSLLSRITGKDEKNPLEAAKKKKKVGGEQMSLFGADEVAVKKKTEEPIVTNMKSLADVPHNYVLVDTKEKRADLIDKLMKQPSVCFDTETTSVDVFSAELVGLSFSYSIGEAYFVSLPEDTEEIKNIVSEFSAFFENEGIEKIGQNLKFDLLMLSMYGIQLKGKLFDTMIAHYLVQPELRHGMDYLAEIYLKYRTIRYEELVGAKGKNQASIRTVDINALCDYAAEDADVTFQLKQVLEKELKANGLEKLFYEIEMPLMRVLAIMEENGVRIDSEALHQSSEVLTGEMLKLEKEIHEMAGTEFNVSSAKQVGEVLFVNMKIDENARKTKSGQYSTSEDVLEKLRSKHPIVGKILEYRGLKKLLSTYIDALPLLINSKTGKVHTSYNQTVTSTGRLSSSNPNLQNIPIRDSQGKEIRKAFIPEKDCMFFSADYSQIELRIMAHLSEDKNMLDAFNSGYDIHTATAAKIFKVPLNEVTSGMRRKAKTANFGIIYGISAFGLADRLNISRTEAKELIDGYFETYPSVKLYIENTVKKAKENGYVETLLGRKRFLPDINSQNSIVRNYAERNAINAPIQGTAADIIKIAMVRIQKRIETEKIKSEMIMQVHDELNFNVLKPELEKVRKLVIEEMEQAFMLAIPLVADCGVGDNWLEAH
ncbi:DNA polymerase I [Paludibacter sp. 221]|uniref:DNA polymerase I n=1 Tax=Paludibacter sp. 221 TaxID=2302939 RepID=UPI0013D6B63D|nr:DNA polymerase I [Paludibacter sp. 221]NDV47384.1 DNA polymerase I [Paludibacter sp. 221]